MNIGCIYTVETYHSLDKPLSAATEIPFGISFIITVLEQNGFDVELFVITPDTDVSETLFKYIENKKPKLLCYTAVSTQFSSVKEIAINVRKFNQNIFQILGGHHASLDSEKTISEGVFDAICVGEGENAVVELARNIENLSQSDFSIKPINNLWFYDSNNKKIIRNQQSSFRQDLNELPLINRKIWDQFIYRPDDYPALLLGRGCPFKCTYCSNHAMAKLSDGKYVRFRSPENIINEIEYIQDNYKNVERIYLEVETFGANKKASFQIFDALCDYNKKHKKRIKFGANLALTSNFMSNEERCHELLEKCKNANLKIINIGLESGSERMRKDILKRPHYTNDELVRFCKLSRQYDINVVFFVLMGLPGETLKDYFETVKTARRAQPHNCYVSIFYPYLGTDLDDNAISLGIIHPRNLRETFTSKSERARAILNLEGFSSRRIRFEYIVFWIRVYLGYWTLSKVLIHSSKSFLRAYPSIYSKVFYLRDIFEKKTDSTLMDNAHRIMVRRKFDKTIGTRMDVMTE